MTKESFIKMWDTVVKPQATICCERAKEVSARDHYALEPISNMIWAVEHDIADGRVPGLGSMTALLQIAGCLSSDDYYTAIHQDMVTEELTDLKKLGKLAKELIEVETRV